MISFAELASSVVIWINHVGFIKSYKSSEMILKPETTKVIN
jgi:hypothetical protein